MKIYIKRRYRIGFCFSLICVGLLKIIFNWNYFALVIVTIICYTLTILLFCLKDARKENLKLKFIEIMDNDSNNKALKKQYIDINQNKIDLSKLSLDELRNLNFQEETFFADQIKKLKPYSAKRNNYMKQAYKKIFLISDWIKKRENKAGNGATGQSIYFLQKIIKKKLRCNNILNFYEAGIGKANAIRNILNYPVNMYGCDIFLSEEAKKIIKENDRKNLHIVQKDLYHALDEIEDNSIDVFYADNVLEHVVEDEYQETIKKITRKLKKDGILFAVIPNINTGPNDITKFYKPKRNKTLGFHFMEQTYNQNMGIFKKCGLEEAKIVSRGVGKKIVCLPPFKVLKSIKLSLENYLMKKNVENDELFIKLGYDLYVLRKRK